MRALALALLALGCSSAPEAIEGYIKHNARAPEYLACGWAPSQILILDPPPQIDGEPALCWVATPTEARALALVDDACEAESAPVKFPGGPLYIFARPGSSDNAVVRRHVEACDVTP